MRLVHLTVSPPTCLVAAVALAACTIPSPLPGQSTEEARAEFEKIFDTHWQRLKDDYPYFKLYSVDWDAERADHRPRAIAAKSATEFTWELAKLVSALPDPHVSFIPSVEMMEGNWSYPDVKSRRVERRVLVLDWPEGQEPSIPEKFRSDPHAYPEIVKVQGEPLVGVAHILAAGPLDTTFTVRLRWPDGSEVDHELRRPKESNLPPTPKHYGKKWLVTGRVGSIGYMRIKTFDPDAATLGPDGKMTTMLRAALKKLKKTEGLIIDLQGNGGGLVAASDPFLGNLLKRRKSYRWGNSGGKTRVIRPRKPRYAGDVVVIVDAGSASGGEWAARILRDARRAKVIGGRTAGAEAAVHTSTADDGSKVNFSAWPMAEPGVTPFQEKGIQLDHSLPLTIESVRKHGYETAKENVRRARFAKALELLGGSSDDLDALLELAEDADRPSEAKKEEEPTGAKMARAGERT